MKTDIIKIENIKVKERSRKEYKNISELASSIDKLGLIHNLAVRETKKDNYDLLAGGRRLRALKELGWTKVAVNIFEIDEEVTELKYREIELEENLIRAPLTWQEEVNLKSQIVKLKQELYGEKSRGPDKSGISASDVAAILGETPQNLSLDLQLAKALEFMPKLSEAKNKSEARRFILSVGKQMQVNDAAQSIKELDANSRVDIRKKELADSYIISDTFENMKQLPDGCINFLDVDPPFGIDLKKTKKLKDRLANAILGGYNEIEAADYPEFITELFKECYRLLTDDGWMIAWFGSEPWFEVFFSAIVNAGFLCKRIPLIWNKIGQPGQTMQPNRYLANNYEMVFYACKTDKATINKKGRSNIYSYNRVSYNDKVQPTEKPIELMVELIKTFIIPESSKLLLTPFAGSGNTILAASNLGMMAAGTDLEEKYRNGFLSKIATQPYRKYRSYEK